jgi:hypothetical protein
VARRDGPQGRPQLPEIQLAASQESDETDGGSLDKSEVGEHRAGDDVQHLRSEEQSADDVSRQMWRPRRLRELAHLQCGNDQKPEGERGA